MFQERVTGFKHDVGFLQASFKLLQRLGRPLPPSCTCRVAAGYPSPHRFPSACAASRQGPSLLATFPELSAIPEPPQR